MRVGVIGLGTGTIAAYGRKGDTYRFYDIDPHVIDIATREFSFLSGSAARIELAVGDARVALEQELARGDVQRFNVLALDAFSSDSIPVHLLTREAAQVYLRHLATDGILAIHISNRFLDLKPVVRGLAKELRLAHLFVSSDGDDALSWRSTWALLARTQEPLDPAADSADDEPVRAKTVLWTDDYSNLFRVLKR